MAGLPCDACQEPSLILPTGVDSVGEDVDGQLIYRRYRVCINPTCERYRQRRETLEAYLPETGKPVLMDTQQLRQYLPPGPADNSQPTLFDDC